MNSSSIIYHISENAVPTPEDLNILRKSSFCSIFQNSTMSEW